MYNEYTCGEYILSSLAEYLEENEIYLSDFIDKLTQRIFDNAIFDENEFYTVYPEAMEYLFPFEDINEELIDLIIGNIWKMDTPVAELYRKGWDNQSQIDIVAEMIKEYVDDIDEDPINCAHKLIQDADFMISNEKEQKYIRNALKYGYAREMLESLRKQIEKRIARNKR